MRIFSIYHFRFRTEVRDDKEHRSYRLEEDGRKAEIVR